MFLIAKCFVSAMNNAVVDIRTIIDQHIQAIPRVRDKSKMQVTVDHGSTIIAVRWLRLCLTDVQLINLRALNTVTVHAEVMDRTFRELKTSMQAAEVEHMYKRFDLTADASDYIAFRKILGQAFRLDVRRQHAKSDRKAFKLIDVKPAWLKDLRDTYGCELLQMDPADALVWSSGT